MACAHIASVTCDECRHLPLPTQMWRYVEDPSELASLKAERDALRKRVEELEETNRLSRALLVNLGSGSLEKRFALLEKVAAAARMVLCMHGGFSARERDAKLRESLRALDAEREAK